MKTTRTARLIFVLFLIFCVNAGGRSQAAALPAQTNQTVEVKIYFPKADPNDDNLVAVTRRLPKTSRVADAALRELLRGANESDRENQLESSYSPDSIIAYRKGCSSQTAKPLLDYYLGVKIRRGVATVNFRAGAECYLHTTASMQARVLAPIDKTLMQFKSIKTVQYAINGKVITEWDA